MHEDAGETLQRPARILAPGVMVMPEVHTRPDPPPPLAAGGGRGVGGVCSGLVGRGPSPGEQVVGEGPGPPGEVAAGGHCLGGCHLKMASTYW